jgi:hypothetical protein
MYEFDSPDGKIDLNYSSDTAPCCEGWLIQRVGIDAEVRPGMDPPRYLQIGTGQWCGAEYATLFPIQSSALVYVKEFGFEVGRHVRVIWHRKE